MSNDSPPPDRAPPCPVCESTNVRFFVEADRRRYFRCTTCVATFLDPMQRPSIEEERLEYDRHRNDPGDPDYRRFLSRLAEPLIARLEPGARGLDYGCGPGPALAQMLREAGFPTDAWDPIYASDSGLLDRQYDFITCTEVVEHMHRPAEEFRRLDRLLSPGGWLGVMTRFQTDDSRFAGWHYRRDPTHVVFYRASTLERIAERLGWRARVFPPDVAMLRKPGR